MKKIDLAEDFKFAHRGLDVVTYEQGEREVEDEVAEAAEASGVLVGQVENVSQETSLSPAHQKALIAQTMLTLIADDNERADDKLWAEGGEPKVSALNDRLKDSGVKVSAKERDEIWAEVGGSE